MVTFERAARAAGVRDPRVLAAVAAVPREAYVPPHLRDEAGIDAPVSLPCGQTTSQPSLIALMVEALALRSDDVVLEVGTGWGYQTAVLAHLAQRVVTVEWFAELAQAAIRNLAAQGLGNVLVVTGDGRLGYPPEAPYAGVVVAARTTTVPTALVAQVADGGRLVVPVGDVFGQDVAVLTVRQGRLAARRSLGAVRFVPLLGGDDD